MGFLRKSFAWLWLGVLLLFIVGAIILGPTVFYLMGWSGESANKRHINGARTLEEADAMFTRIEASYEVIETGEQIDFDYVVSAYNRDIAGSFSGVYTPQVMFKATSNGAVIAIDPPRYYYTYGYDIPPNRSPMEPLPLLMWYPDVNDLGFGIAYVTADAYRSPNAKVKVLDYKASASSRAEFLTWREKAKAEYVQIGAIPGPYGCATNGGVTKEMPSCSTSFSRSLDLTMHLHGAIPAKSIKWSDKMKVAFRKTLPNNGSRYICYNAPSKGQKLSAIAHLKDKRMSRSRTLVAEGRDPELKGGVAIFNSSHQKVWNELRRQTTAYLDLKTARGETNEVFVNKFYHGQKKKLTTDYVPIITIYPTLRYRHPEWHKGEKPIEETFFLQIETDPDWRGFAFDIAPRKNLDGSFEKKRWINEVFPQFQPPSFDGEERSVLFIDGQYACGWKNRGERYYLVFDMKKGLTIAVGSVG